MSIFGYLMDSWVHTGALVFLSIRAREYTGGDIHRVALQDRVWSQYWASWTPKWIAASQWLMSIFGYPMDSWVHTGTLVFMSLRAREYTGGDLCKVSLHRVSENGHQPLGRGNSLWHSACPILWSNPILQRYFTKIAPGVLPCPKTQEHQSTCVDSWVHRVPENGHQQLGRGNSLWHSACPILWSNPIF